MQMKILMPIDGSVFSNAALTFIASRAALSKQQVELELLNVQHPVSERVASVAGIEMVLHYHATESASVFKPALEMLKQANIKVKTTALVGSPGAQTCRTAIADAVDLIIMGSHGHTGLKNLLFGSVTQTVLASCTTPLLVLRDDAVPKNDSLKVGIALDGSKYSYAVVRYLMKHHALFGEKPIFTLIHVVPDLLSLVMPGFSGGESVRALDPEQVAAMQGVAVERAMSPARAVLKAAGFEIAEVKLVDSIPGDAIADYASKNALDVVAMGSHGEGRFKSAMLGSVATRVAAKCHTALLLIREE
jgi:nucleotide-binding universal stress UspA family protein